MSSQDVSREQVLGYLRLWKDRGTKLLLYSLDHTRLYNQVDVFGVAEDNSTVAFAGYYFKVILMACFVDSAIQGVVRAHPFFSL